MAKAKTRRPAGADKAGRKANTTANANANVTRVAAVQWHLRSVSSFEDFARQCRFFVEAAAGFQADFVLFPELLSNPLQALVPSASPAATARRLSEFTPRYRELFRELALRHAINIIGGSILTVEDDRLYNIAHLFRRDGSVAKQYKLHITPSEATWWGVAPGDRVEVFATDRGPIAILICYDSEFPELARIARAKGADVIFVPFNTDLRSSYLRVRYCAQARCIENHVYCVLSGVSGALDGIAGIDVHYAQSCVLTPSDIPFARDGVAAEAEANSEALVVHDLDLGLLQRTRTSGSVRTWADRRSDLYRVAYRDGDGESSV